MRTIIIGEGVESRTLFIAMCGTDVPSAAAVRTGIIGKARAYRDHRLRMPRHGLSCRPATLARPLVFAAQFSRNGRRLRHHGTAFSALSVNGSPFSMNAAKMP